MNSIRSTPPIGGDAFVSRVIDQGRFGAQQLLIVGLCLFLNMLDGFDITAMAIVAADVQTELGLTADRLGWVFAFALAGMMSGAMLLAPVSDLIGRRSLIILSVVLVGVSILLTANASSLGEFIVLRFVSGFGAGAMLACQATLAAEYSPDRYRAAAVAVVTSGYPLGAMMTSVVAGHVMPEFGWRGMFWFGGALTLAMVVVAWLLIPESIKYLFERRPANALTRINRILDKLGEPRIDAMPPAAVAVGTSRNGVIANMLKLLSPPHRVGTLMLWSAFFLCFSTLYFLMSWIPILVTSSGHDQAAGRQAFFLFNLGGVVGIYLISFLSTRYSLTNLVFALSASAGALMVVFAYASADLGVLLALILAIGILQQGGFTGLYSTAAKVYPTGIRSTGIGWAIGLGRSGAVAGPAVAGYLIDAGFDMSANFTVFAVPVAVGGFIAYLLHVD